MKSTVKKVLAMLMVICMVLPMFAMTVFATVETGTGDSAQWEYNSETKVLTYTAGGTSGKTTVAVPTASDDIKNFSAEVTEVVIKNNGGIKFISMSPIAFQTDTANGYDWTALKKVTMPKSMYSFGGTRVFNAASSLEEIVVEGEAYIPGAADLSYLTREKLSYTTTLADANHRSFEGTKIKTFILPAYYYSESYPIKAYPEPDHWAAKNCSFGNAVETIMGPYDDAYLRSFAAANDWDYVPYGKIGEGTAWTYDEDAKIVTIYGNGTSSALTALSSADVAILKDATKVIIRSDITSIETDALAGLTNLKEVEFLGNAPATEGNPFGEIMGLDIMVPTGATGFGDTWNGYTVVFLVQGTVSNVDWVYNPNTKVFTITANGASSTPPDIRKETWAQDFYAKVEEAVLKNGTSSFTTLAYGTFQLMTSLKKVTLPSTVTNKSSYGQQFNGASSLKEIVVTGNAYIPGAADFSSMGAVLVGDHRVFEGTAIETLILKGGIYDSENNPIRINRSTTGANMLGSSLKTIMSSHDDAYLRSFAAENGYKYVSYGKIGEGTAWTYDEDAKIVTIYGNGTSSTLTALSSADVEFLKDATKVVISADITSIETDALAGLTSLTDVVFEGNAPATEGNPFGTIEGLTVTISLGATGFGETWHGYVISYPTVEGTFDPNGGWKFDGATGTLYIWSNQSGNSLLLSDLTNNADFVAFAEGEYAASVKIVKFFNEDGSVSIKRIDGNNNGFKLFADAGLTNIEQIYIGENVNFYRITNLFNGLNKLTTFGLKDNTDIGTVDLLAPTKFDGGDATGTFSGQTGIKKVILPRNNEWGNSYSISASYGNHWANIPANYFKGMTGLEEVVLNSSSDLSTTTLEDGTPGLSCFRGTCMIGANAFDGCVNLKTLTIPATAPASALFRRSNGQNEHTVNLFNADTFAGSSIETLYVLTSDVANAADYNIPNVAGMKIICANAEVKAEFENDAPAANISSILTGVGVSVRYEKYNGLRNIFSFNNAVNSEMEYTLVEYGAMLVSADKLGDDTLTINPTTLETTVVGAVKVAIWNKDAENPWQGKVLSYDENGETRFALTLINFTSNWDSDVYGCAYAVYEDNNGNRFVVYADNGNAISFYDAMVSGALQGYLNNLVCDDVAVWSVLETGKVENGDIDAGEGIQAMVISGKTDEDAKVLVVRMANGELADDAAIAAAKAAAVAAGYDALNDKVIALDFLA